MSRWSFLKEDDNMAKAAVKSVPAGTETKAWRAMSATVALAFWLAQQRNEKISGQTGKADAWAEVASDYRALTRKALRGLHKEGIKFDSSRNVDALSTEDGAWQKKSARVAWVLWLHQHRSRQGLVDEEAEKAVWAGEADEFRKVIRTALLSLNDEGVSLFA
jgi:hypothetical protein